MLHNSCLKYVWIYFFIDYLFYYLFLLKTRTYTHFQYSHTLTYGVGAAELFADDILHVAMETEEDLHGVHLHLQSTGQVHHLTHTHTQTHLVTHCVLVSSEYPVCMLSVAALPCAPVAAGHRPCRTRTAACARRRPAPAESPRSPPAAPSGGTSPGLTHRRHKEPGNISLIQIINQEMCKSQSVNKNSSFEALLSGVDVTSEIRADDREEEQTRGVRERRRRRRRVCLMDKGLNWPSNSSVLSIWPGKDDEFWSPVSTNSFHCSYQRCSIMYLPNTHTWTHSPWTNTLLTSSVGQTFSPQAQRRRRGQTLPPLSAFTDLQSLRPLAFKQIINLSTGNRSNVAERIPHLF